MPKKIILKIIEFYQFFISSFMSGSCRFYPSCSEYAKENIKKYGIIKGFKNGFLRILRCHPFGKGGVDLP